MKLSKIAQTANISSKGLDTDLPLTFKTDSRELTPGDGFIATTGANTDGHNFIQEALQKGARAILARREKIPQTLIDSYPDRLFLLCQNPTELSAAKLAQKWLQHINPQNTVAITGSVGKTSTREFLKTAIGDQLKHHGAIKSHNTLIGCAITILSSPQDSQVIILEMGANHKGEIAQMTEHFPPTIAAITEISPVHLEGFLSMEGILNAKIEIMTSPKLAHAVINNDNKLLADRISSTVPSKKIFTFGKLEKQTEKPTEKQEKGRPHMSFTPQSFKIENTSPHLTADLCYNNKVVHIDVPLMGRHNLYPLSCALSIAVLLGCDFQKSAANTKNVQAYNGRGQLKKTKSGAILIDESYNASPAAVKASLDTFLDIQIKGSKYLILGDMKELGVYEKIEHLLVLEKIKNSDAQTTLIGPAWQDLHDETVPFFKTVQEAIPHIDSIHLTPQDAILIKGSNSNHLNLIVQRLCQ